MSDDSLKFFTIGTTYVRIDSANSIAWSRAGWMGIAKTNPNQPLLCVGSQKFVDGNDSNYAVFLCQSVTGESVEVVAGDAIHVKQYFKVIG